MGADPIVYCLERLTDYAQFERLCHELMALEGYPSIEPLGGCKDKGRDAIHVNRVGKVVSIFCYSVRDDWFTKLKQDAKVIHQHQHACNELVYLSTHDFTAGERDSAVKFIKNNYGWDLEAFGLERLRLLLSAKHRSLLANHPQIFHPSFFETQQPKAPEITRIRSLMERFVAANEKYIRAQVRLLVWPYSQTVSPADLQNRDRRITVAIPTPEAQDPPPIGPDIVLSKAAVQGCSQVDFWGVTGVKRDGVDSTPDSRALLLIWAGRESADAAEEFNQLAAESGRLYQTLPPSLAPIRGTTSPRNLWAAVLYGWLRGTLWVSKGDGFEYLGLPFAASAELWRRLLHGTTPDGRVDSSPLLSEEAQELLLAATAGKRQTVTMSFGMRGMHLGTGDGPIIETDDDRQKAECRSWVDELFREGLIEDRWHKGQVFAVTKKGYQIADAIRAH